MNIFKRMYDWVFGEVVPAKPAGLKPMPKEVAPKVAPLISPVATPVAEVKKTKAAPRKLKSNWTKAKLEKLSKQEIDVLAEKDFGAKLDRRIVKTKLIEAFMAAQRTFNKK